MKKEKFSKIQKEEFSKRVIKKGGNIHEISTIIRQSRIKTV